MEAKYIINSLPPSQSLQTPAILRSLVGARAALGELRGTAKSLPNQGILIDTLFLQEALASSKIENIVTTQDEVFRVNLSADEGTPAAKEVARYRVAMRRGYEAWLQRGVITQNMLIDMFQTLKKRDERYRQAPGTVLRNAATGKTVYKPPQEQSEIIRLMGDLESFINGDGGDLDPLIKMALIHHQFESIHPFSDGNGRVGRMLNILYLTHAKLLDAPILYLSRAINAAKPEYYRLLQAVRDEGVWEEWVVYMLKAVNETSRSTLLLVEGIRELMQKAKNRMREDLGKIYSQELLNHLFSYPYTRISYLQEGLSCRRLTASKYLKRLAEYGFVREEKKGRNNYYINEPLVKLFVDVSAEDKEAAAE